MTERFQRLVKIVLAHEGGYVNDPDDPGGETKYGISKRAYPELDIENLTEDQAKEIYFSDYYSHYMDSLFGDRITLLLFDFGVNAGPRRATRLVQRVVGANDDGVLGPKTVKAINEYDPDRIIRDYAVEIALFYMAINNRKFLKGWLKRLMDNVTRGL